MVFISSSFIACDSGTNGSQLPYVEHVFFVNQRIAKSKTPVTEHIQSIWCALCFSHDDVTQWKNFPCYLPFVRGIHRLPVNSLHKGQWRGALMFLICAWINGWVNNRDAGNLGRHRTHYNVTVMITYFPCGFIETGPRFNLLICYYHDENAWSLYRKSLHIIWSPLYWV